MRRRLAPPQRVGAPPTENPGSATGREQSVESIYYKTFRFVPICTDLSRITSVKVNVRSFAKIIHHKIVPRVYPLHDQLCI